MEPKVSLKEKVHHTFLPFATESELIDHSTHTEDTVESQREFLKRLVVERSPDPLSEADTIHVIGKLDVDSICPFINGHIAKDS